jgi:hypothetical protein
VSTQGVQYSLFLRTNKKKVHPPASTLNMMTMLVAIVHSNSFPAMDHWRIIIQITLPPKTAKVQNDIGPFTVIGLPTASVLLSWSF